MMIIKKIIRQVWNKKKEINMYQQLIIIKKQKRVLKLWLKQARIIKNNKMLISNKFNGNSNNR